MLVAILVLGWVNVGRSQSGPLEPDLVGAFYLSYPLDPTVFNATSKRINSVFDHSMPGGRYSTDGIVTAYTGQEGRLSFNTQTPATGVYTHAPGAEPFILGGAYFGGFWGTEWLSYDGHPGLDIRTVDLTPIDDQIGSGHVNVFAAAGGFVDCVFVPASDERFDTSSCEGGGGSIVINHGNGYRTIYMHLYQPLVAQGDQVARGQKIGVAGQRGAPNQPHLHFEVRRGVASAQAPSVDPYGWNGGCLDPYRKAVNTNLWTNSGTTWNFDQDGNAAGWLPNSIEGPDGITHIECFSIHHDSTINSGALWIDPSGNDPSVQSPPLVNVAASEFTALEMRLISGSPSTNGRVYFTTSDSPEWSEAKSVDFPVTNTGGWQVITVPMFQRNSAWRGTITAIRIDPADIGLPGDPSDTIAFDYIKLTSGQPSASITANGQDGAVTVRRDEALRIEIGADGGTAGFANPSELYFGLNTSGATYWLTPQGTFTTTVTRLYRGLLPSFGPTTLLNLPSAGVLPDGSYRWFVLVVNGTTPIYDIVTTTIGDGPAQAPFIANLNPASPPAVNADQSIGVSGSHFQPGLIVDVFNSAGVKIGTLSGTQIQNVTTGSFTMIANLGAAAATFGIEAVNPDGQRSNRHVFATAPASAPAISGLNPSSPPVVNGNQSIGVLGSNFQAGLIVDVFNSAGGKIGTLSGTQIQNVNSGSFTMIANLGATSGTFGIEVVNPDGKRSNRHTFNTVNPTPVISGLNPASPPVVNGNQSIGVFGSNFLPGLIVDVFNSSGVKIGTLSGTQIQNVSSGGFTMIANLGSTPGTFGIEVVNPDGKRSSRRTFSTVNPTPVISGLSPSSPPVVNGNQSIGVFGSNFLPGLIVDVYNSSGVKIGTLSGTQIQNVSSGSFTMIANLGAGPATFGIEVLNPDGKRSNRWMFSTR